MQVTGSGRDQVLRFETNVHDFATAGAEHALRIELDPRTKPRRLIFTFARALKRLSAAQCFTILWLWAKRSTTSSGCGAKMFFPIAPAADVEAWLEDDA